VTPIQPAVRRHTTPHSKREEWRRSLSHTHGGLGCTTNDWGVLTGASHNRAAKIDLLTLYTDGGGVQMSDHGSSGSTVMRGTWPSMPFPTSRMRESTLETQSSRAEAAIVVVRRERWRELEAKKT
jgi:hypothetical protein